MKCDVCRLRIDPVAAPIHGSCEDTPEGAYIRSVHPYAHLKASRPRINPPKKKT